MCVLSIKVPIRKKSGNVFNDPRIYIYIYIYRYVYLCVCVCVCAYIYVEIYFIVGPKRERNILKRIGLRRDLYFLKIYLFIYFVLIHMYVSSLLLSLENICVTKTCKWGTQWDFNSLVFEWFSVLYGSLSKSLLPSPDCVYFSLFYF